MSAAVAPPNPFLVDSAWPIAQHDNYAQASTTLPGPAGDAPMKADHLLNTAVSGTLTALYAEGNEVLWGSSLRAVYKVDRSTDELVLIDSVGKPSELLAADTFRGIYSLLSNSSTFYVAAGNGIAAYTDEIQGDPRSRIVGVGVFIFEQAQPDEVILSVSMTYDGYLVFLTNLGTVGVVTSDLAQLVDLEMMSKRGPNLVSNSMAVDEFGGIYVVTSRFLCRMWWDPSVPRIQYSEPPSGDEHVSVDEHCESDRCNSWCTAYDTEKKAFEERPTKFGSGTTPSLLRHPETDQLYVVIADGSRQQNVAVFDAFSGELAAKAPVSFGREIESYTEQSLLVFEDKIVVVQNAFTDAAKRMNNLLKAWNATDIATSAGLPRWAVENVYLLPVALGDSPRGYQQFQFNPLNEDPSTRLTATWTNLDSGCPNAIPTMSSDTRMLYCVSKFDYMNGRRYPSGFEGGWALEALSWDTGEQLFIIRSGNDLRYNAMYAATQIGPDSEVIYGSIGGLTRFRLATSEEIHTATDGGLLDLLVAGDGNNALDLTVGDSTYFFSGFVRDFAKTAMTNLLLSGTEDVPIIDFQSIWNSLPVSQYLGSEAAFTAALRSGAGSGLVDSIIEIFSNIGNGSISDFFGDSPLDVHLFEKLFNLFSMAMESVGEDGSPTGGPGDDSTPQDHFLALANTLGGIVSDDSSTSSQKLVAAARAVVQFVVEMIETVAAQKGDSPAVPIDHQRSKRRAARKSGKSHRRQEVTTAPPSPSGTISPPPASPPPNLRRGESNPSQSPSPSTSPMGCCIPAPCPEDGPPR